MAPTSRQLQCLALLEAQGYAISGAAALVGNFVQESGPNLPSAFRTGKLDHGSQALPQWRLGRLTAYEAWVREQHPEVIEDGMTEAQIQAALWPWFGNMSLQVRYIKVELERDYAALHKELVKGGDVATLAAAVCWQYERPSKTLSGISNRIAAAKALAATAAQTPAKNSFVDLPTALAGEQAQHVAQRNGAVVGASGSVMLAGAVVSTHVAHFLAWWEWGLLALLASVAVVSVITIIQAGTAASTLKTAAAGTAALPTAATIKVVTPAPLPPTAQLVVAAAEKPVVQPAPITSALPPATPLPSDPAHPSTLAADPHKI